MMDCHTTAGLLTPRIGRKAEGTGIRALETPAIPSFRLCWLCGTLRAGWTDHTWGLNLRLLPSESDLVRRPAYAAGPALNALHNIISIPKLPPKRKLAQIAF